MDSLFSSKIINFYKYQRADQKKGSEEDEQPLEEFISTHCRLQAKCQ